MTEQMPRKPKVGDHILWLYKGEVGSLMHVLRIHDEEDCFSGQSGIGDIDDVFYADYGKTWRFADETPAPIAERKPRELSDTQCSALSHEPPSKTRFLVATYERMRPGLMKGGQ